MTQSIMLGDVSVKEFHGPMTDFMSKLQGNEGRQWFDEFKKFLRHEPCWAGDRKTKHLIDLAANPFTPQGWTIEEHQKPVGKKNTYFAWDASKVKLHLDPSQKDGKTIERNTLRTKLADQPVLNANVLDHLLAHPELIPEDWKDTAVFFWGTVYRNSDGRLYVRCLYWGGGSWRWSFDRLGYDWGADHPALVRAK